MTWPGVNASLNATCAVLLMAGAWAIKTQRVSVHRACMVAACAVSAVFLASYLAYHAQVGTTRFQGTGWVRPVYFSLLLSHTILAVVILPLILRTLWLAVRQRFDQHRRLARWTLPLWLYVSITGVVVYWLLYVAFPSIAEACPGCKEALFDPAQLPQRLRTARGYAWSIAALLGVPLTLIGGLTLWVVKSQRR